MEEPMMLENYSEFGQLFHRPSHSLERMNLGPADVPDLPIMIPVSCVGGV